MCSTLFIIREMKIKITMRYHFICTRMAKLSKTDHQVLTRI